MSSNVINAQPPPIRATMGKMPTMVSPLNHQEQSNGESSLKNSVKGLGGHGYKKSF
jgi:hypothetical protein